MCVTVGAALLYDPGTFGKVWRGSRCDQGSTRGYKYCLHSLNLNPFQIRLYFQFDIYRTVHIKGTIHQIKIILQPGHNQSKAAMLLEEAESLQELVDITRLIWYLLSWQRGILSGWATNETMPSDNNYNRFFKKSLQLQENSCISNLNSLFICVPQRSWRVSSRAEKPSVWCSTRDSSAGLNVTPWLTSCC